MSQIRSGRVDMARRYALAAGVRVIPRSADVVQIGTDPPRRVLVRDAPPRTFEVLTNLDGAKSLGNVLTQQEADPLVWHRLVEQLLAAELLLQLDRQPEDEPPIVLGAHLLDERSGLVHRHGFAAASRIMQARDDALVVVRGNSLVATSIATVLGAAGVGHIHTDPGAGHRPQAQARNQALALVGSAPARAPLTAAAQAAARQRMVIAGPSDRSAVGEPAIIAGVLRELYPNVRVHPPAAHQHPTIVVLAGGQAPDLGVAARLTRERIPHLAVTAGTARAVVGPLVLPGRSSCLSCAHRHRTDADPGWPSVARRVSTDDARPPAFLVTAAASLAIGQVLEHIDGITMPGTVNGTLEWFSGDLGPRRRSWLNHPGCGCRSEV
jgi:hypothetical protein